MDSDINQLRAQLNELQLQFSLKFGASPGSSFQQDPTLGTGATSQLPRPLCIVQTVVATNIPATPGFLTIAYNQDIYNPTGGMHDAVGDPTKLHVPVAGVYLINVEVVFGTAIHTGIEVTMYTQVNGNPLPNGSVINSRYIGVNGIATLALNLNGLYYFQTGDTVTINLTTTSATTEPFQSSFASLVQVF